MRIECQARIHPAETCSCGFQVASDIRSLLASERQEFLFLPAITHERNIPTHKSEIEKVNDTKVIKISGQDLRLIGSYCSLRHSEFTANRLSLVYLNLTDSPSA